MNGRRETSREEAVRSVSHAAAELILSLPEGTETTIAQVVGYYCEELGYKWGRIEGVMDYGWTKDGGKTFLIADDDLFEVQRIVTGELAGRRELDNSKYAMMEVGLPYNIPFVIREAPGKPIVRIGVFPAKGFGSTEFTVYDSRRDNFRIRNVSFTGEDAADTRDYTVPYREIGTIRKKFADPLFREEPEEGYETEPGFAVTGESSWEVTVYGEGEEYEFTLGDLRAYRDHLDGYPQTRALLDAVQTVLEIAARLAGTDLQ